MKKNQAWKSKKVILSLVLFGSLMTLFTVVSFADGESAMSAVSHLQDKMKLNNIGSIIGVTLGKMVFDGLSWVSNLTEGAFNQIIRFDLINEISGLTKAITNLELSVELIFIIALSVTLLIRMFTMEEPFSALYSAVIVVFLLIVFSFGVTMVNTGKIAMMNFINGAVQGGNTMSESLFLDNTYDLKYLIEQAESGNKIVVNLSEQGVPAKAIRSIQSDEILTKGEFGYKTSWDTVSESEKAVKVRDGWNGLMDERYLRYNTSYFEINITLFVVVFVYLMAIIKGAQSILDLMIIRLTGKPATAMGAGDPSKAIKPLSKYLQATISILVLFLLVSLFGAVASGILAIPNANLNFLGKILFILSFGMMILFGSDYLDTVFGFEGARRTLMTGYLMSKGIGKATGGAKKAFDKGKEAYDDYKLEKDDWDKSFENEKGNSSSRQAKNDDIGKDKQTNKGNVHQGNESHSEPSSVPNLDKKSQKGGSDSKGIKPNEKENSDKGVNDGSLSPSEHENPTEGFDAEVEQPTDPTSTPTLESTKGDNIANDKGQVSEDKPENKQAKFTSPQEGERNSKVDGKSHVNESTYQGYGESSGASGVSNERQVPHSEDVQGSGNYSNHGFDASSSNEIEQGSYNYDQVGEYESVPSTNSSGYEFVDNQFNTGHDMSVELRRAQRSNKTSQHIDKKNDKWRSGTGVAVKTFEKGDYPSSMDEKRTKKNRKK